MKQIILSFVYLSLHMYLYCKYLLFLLCVYFVLGTLIPEL